MEIHRYTIVFTVHDNYSERESSEFYEHLQVGENGSKFGKIFSGWKIVFFKGNSPTPNIPKKSFFFSFYIAIHDYLYFQ